MVKIRVAKSQAYELAASSENVERKFPRLVVFIIASSRVLLDKPFICILARYFGSFE